MQNSLQCIINYEVKQSEHLANVSAAVSDVKIHISSSDVTLDFYSAEVLSSQDYFPFGMLMPGRSLSSHSYRFGHNGQEPVNELTGINGSHYTALFWEYDARLGRRWNFDPVDKPWMSSYHAFSNKPMCNTDPNGALDDIYITGEGADQAFEQLKSTTTNLILERDEEGKVLASGDVTKITDSERRILSIINDPNVTVNITTSLISYSAGSYQGTTFDKSEKTAQ